MLRYVRSLGRVVRSLCWHQSAPSIRFFQIFDISTPSKGMYHGGSEHGDGALKPPKNFICEIKWNYFDIQFTNQRPLKWFPLTITLSFHCHFSSFDKVIYQSLSLSIAHAILKKRLKNPKTISFCCRQTPSVLMTSGNEVSQYYHS